MKNRTIQVEEKTVNKKRTRHKAKSIKRKQLVHKPAGAEPQREDYPTGNYVPITAPTRNQYPTGNAQVSETHLFIGTPSTGWEWVTAPTYSYRIVNNIYSAAGNNQTTLNHIVSIYGSDGSTDVRTGTWTMVANGDASVFFPSIIAFDESIGVEVGAKNTAATATTAANHVAATTAASDYNSAQTAITVAGNAAFAAALTLNNILNAAALAEAEATTLEGDLAYAADHSTWAALIVTRNHHIKTMAMTMTVRSIVDHLEDAKETAYQQSLVDSILYKDILK